jgi:hypothetical protein
MSKPLTEKKFKLKAEEIIDLISPVGAGIATDKITVDGLRVGFMYREEPRDEYDSGWIFLSGTEDQDYVDDPKNMMLYSLNTIANCDPAIIPYLNSPIGTNLERIEGTDDFRIVDF